LAAGCRYHKFNEESESVAAEADAARNIKLDVRKKPAAGTLNTVIVFSLLGRNNIDATFA